MRNLRMRERFRNTEYASRWYSNATQRRFPFGGWSRAQCRLKLRGKGRPIALALLPTRKPGVVNQILTAYRMRQGFELLLFVGSDVEEATARIESARRSCREVAVPHRMGFNARNEKIGN